MSVDAGWDLHFGVGNRESGVGSREFISSLFFLAFFLRFIASLLLFSFLSYHLLCIFRNALCAMSLRRFLLVPLSASRSVPPVQASSRLPLRLRPAIPHYDFASDTQSQRTRSPVLAFFSSFSFFTFFTFYFFVLFYFLINTCCLCVVWLR